MEAQNERFQKGREYIKERMNMDYKRIYICPKFDKCTNHACFMRIPHTRGGYYNKLGNVAFMRCIEKFNEVFECAGQKLKLDEIKFTR